MYVYTWTCIKDVLHTGDVELGTSERVLYAWWGDNGFPADHMLSEGQDLNTIICHPMDECTMIAEQSTGWICYLLKHRPGMVADVYGKHGEQRCMYWFKILFKLRFVTRHFVN